MEKHPYDQLIETVADKMKQHEDDNLGFGIFEKVDKDLGLSRGTAWDASGWKDYCDFGFGDVWFLSLVRSSQYLKIEKRSSFPMEMNSKSETFSYRMPCCPSYSDIRSTSHQRSETLRKMGRQTSCVRFQCGSIAFIHNHHQNSSRTTVGRTEWF